MHYDLSWNPTRHEQREGRVDRYGQPEPTVRVVTFYGENSPIDGLVLDVLLRKHQRIRKSLGVAVPVPTDSAAVIDAILEGLITRGREGEAAFEQLSLDVGDDRQAVQRRARARVAERRRAREAHAHAVRPARDQARGGPPRAARDPGGDRRRGRRPPVRDRGAERVRRDRPRGIRAAAWSRTWRRRPPALREAVGLQRGRLQRSRSPATAPLDARADTPGRAGGRRTRARQRARPLLAAPGRGALRGDPHPRGHPPHDPAARPDPVPPDDSPRRSGCPATARRGRPLLAFTGTPAAPEWLDRRGGRGAAVAPSRTRTSPTSRPSARSSACRRRPA